MKLKNVFLFMSFVALICQMAYGMKSLNTPNLRKERWTQLKDEIRELRNATEYAHLGIPSESAESALDIAGKGDLLTQARFDANKVIIKALDENDEWLQRILKDPQFKQEVQAKDPDALELWSLVKKTDTPFLTPNTPFLTPKRKKYAIGAAIVIALGTLYKKAPQWMKNRVKRILAEHGKTLADVTPAEQDLLISASYARFNPAGSFFFQEAVLDMPEGQTFREELWPVLYHVYYGKKKVGRKRRTELRKLYDEAQEVVREL